MAGVRRLLRRVVDRRSIRDKRWYLPVVLLTPAILVASYGVMLALGRPLPEPRVLWWTAPVLFLVFLLPAVGEEGGWMGYAADPLQDRWGARRGRAAPDGAPEGGRPVRLLAIALTVSPGGCSGCGGTGCRGRSGA
ncbi:MAG TPA: hypothetical protein VFX88_21165 [Actinomycetota bacterium]|nr:hypothetical protein [Actinomycetota bacterium]